MKITYFDDPVSMGHYAANEIYKDLVLKPDTVLCAATGNSPLETYKELGKKFQENPEVFGKLTLVKLDEWGGIPGNSPHSCESYLQKYLVKPLSISPRRYISFHSDPENKEKECQRVERALKAKGPVDVCVLGLGTNGHIAFNEPAAFLNGGCHIARLSKSSLGHSMAIRMKKKPSYGLSLGMSNILNSRKILLLISGENKNSITDLLLSKKITTRLPASFLWLHENTVCLIDRQSSMPNAL